MTTATKEMRKNGENDHQRNAQERAPTKPSARMRRGSGMVTAGESRRNGHLLQFLRAALPTSTLFGVQRDARKRTRKRRKQSRGRRAVGSRRVVCTVASRRVDVRRGSRREPRARCVDDNGGERWDSARALSLSSAIWLGSGAIRHSAGLGDQMLIDTRRRRRSTINGACANRWDRNHAAHGSDSPTLASRAPWRVSDPPTLRRRATAVAGSPPDLSPACSSTLSGPPLRGPFVGLIPGFVVATVAGNAAAVDALAFYSSNCGINRTRRSRYGDQWHVQPLRDSSYGAVKHTHEVATTRRRMVDELGLRRRRAGRCELGDGIHPVHDGRGRSPARCRLHFPGFRESNMDRVARRRSHPELTIWDSRGPSSGASNRTSTPSERGRRLVRATNRSSASFATLLTIQQSAKRAVRYRMRQLYLTLASWRLWRGKIIPFAECRIQ
ncbi:hypothetical protein AB1N83_013452 [Pleurotus pulmonarius]